MAYDGIDVKDLTERAMRSLVWRLRWTRGALLLERIAICFWPVIAWTLAWIAVTRFVTLVDLSQGATIFGICIAVLGWLGFFAIGCRQFRWPSLGDAKARLDQDLPGRPFQALDDTQAIGQTDIGARFLWARHLQKMATQAKNAKAAKPHVRLARRDPWALRLIAVLMFVVAVVFGGSAPVQSIVESLHSETPPLASGPSWEGWAEPPAYTGTPAVYLNDLEPETILKLPQGTLITLRVYGDAKRAKVAQTVNERQDLGFSAAENDLGEVTFDIQANGKITLDPSEGAAQSWRVSMIPDRPPEVMVTGDITHTVQGALKIPFQAQDDYGVVAGDVTIELVLKDVDRRYGLTLEPEPREKLVIDLPLPFTRKTTSFEETVIENLADHPWAGLPVQITLRVTDELGQENSFTPDIGPMPGKRFFDVLAAAVAEQRRDLLWNRENAKRVTMVLKAITYQPEVAFERRGEKPYLLIRTALRRLEYNGDGPLKDEVRDEVAEMLWQAALLIEDGDLADARERFQRAQDRLSEAMKNGATQEEINELMAEMREAMKDYMRQLAQEQRNDPNEQQADSGESQEITQDQLQQMMDRIQELMEQGRMAEAQELMRQLQELMENMRVTEQQGKGEGGDNPMDGLGDTLREQQDLADDTYRELQEQYDQQSQDWTDPGQNQQPGEGELNQELPGQEQGRTTEQGQNNNPSALAERQRSLREMLERQQQQLGQNGIDGGEEFSESLQEAERQMEEAERKLKEGNSPGALDNQADAMEALREGMRQFEDARRKAARNNQDRQQGSQHATPSQQEQDPLGRPLSESGQMGTDKRLGPTEEQYRRAREIMDEIRKRAGDRTRPPIELEYLNRLLERF